MTKTQDEERRTTVEVALRASAHQAFWCAPAPGGRTLVRTPMVYPDGTIIDVFVEKTADGFEMSDLGEARANARMRAKGTARRLRDAGEIEVQVAGLGVRYENGVLRKTPHEGEGLAEAVLRVAQAAIETAA